MPSQLDFINYCFDLQRDNGFLAIWSADEFTSLLDCHPFADIFRPTLLYKEHWGGREVRVEIPGGTYRDLWAAANEAIRESGDDHHIFIEAFSLTDAGEVEMVTGS